MTFWHLSQICELLVCYIRGETCIRHPGQLQRNTWIEASPHKMGIGRFVESLPVVLMAFEVAGVVDEICVRDERSERVWKTLPYSEYIESQNGE